MLRSAEVAPKHRRFYKISAYLEAKVLTMWIITTKLRFLPEQRGR